MNPVEPGLRVRSDSMRFLIEPGDLVYYRRAGLESLSVGDVAVILHWEKGEADYLVHRLWGRFKREGVSHGLTKGDVKLSFDPSLPENSFIGKVVAVRRGRRWIRLDSAKARAIGAVLSVPAAGLHQLAIKPFSRLSGAGAAGSALALCHCLVSRLWDRHLPDLAARLLAGEAPEGAPSEDLSAEREIFGIVEEGASWSGKVRLLGDVYVPPGVTLEILPGTEIGFAPESLCTNHHGRYARSAGRCRILVAGRLKAEGEAASRIRFGGGEPWGGIHFMPGSSGSLARADVSGSEIGGVNGFGRAGLFLREVSFKRNAWGISWRGGTLSMEDGLFEDNVVGIALSLGTLSWKGGRLKGGESGLELLNRSRAKLEGVRLDNGRGHGATISGGCLTARGSIFLSHAGAGLLVKAGGRAELSGCVLEKNAWGLSLQEGLAELQDCRVLDNGRAGVVLSPPAEGAGSARLQWRKGELRGGGTGLELSANARAEIQDVIVDNCLRHGVAAVGGRLTARGCVFSGHGSAGVHASGSARVRLERCSLERNAFGFSLAQGRGNLENCEFSDNTSVGISLSGGRLKARGVRIRDHPVLAMSVAGGEAELAGCVMEGNQAAIRASQGRLRLLAGIVRGGGIGLEVAAQAHVFLKKSSFEDCRGHGVSLLGGALEARRGRFRGCGGAGLHLAKNGAARLSTCRFEKNAFGIAVEEGRAECSSCEILESGRAGISLAGGRARLAWSGGRVLGGEVGVEVGPGAWAQARRSRVENCRRHGALVSGGALGAENSLFLGNAESGISVEKGGALDLARCGLMGNSFGLAVEDGSSNLSRVSVCGNSRVGVSLDSGVHVLDRVAVKGNPQGLAQSPAAAVRIIGDGLFDGGFRAAARRALAHAVFKGAAFPPLRWIFIGWARLSLRLLAFWARRRRGLKALAVHRSWTSSDWRPGTSDIDFVAVARELGEERGLEWCRGFQKSLRRWRAVFPFFGEVLVAGPEDLEAYLRWGGRRAAELGSRGRVLAGGFPRRQRASSSIPGPELLGEAAHAYTRLMQSCLWKRGARAGLARVQAQKAFTDAMRYARAARALSEPLSRAAFEAERCPRSGPRPAHAALCAEALRQLHQSALSLRQGRAADSSAPGGLHSALEKMDAERLVERGRRMRLACELRQALGASLTGGSCDDLYRSYLVLDDDSLEERDLPRLFTALRTFALERGAPGTLPIILSESLWRLWSRLPYLECPARFLEACGEPDRDGLLLPAGAGFPGLWQYSWGSALARRGEGAAPGLQDAAKESLAALRLTWRFTSAGGCFSTEYVRHYLLSRVMGLKLLLQGEAAPFFAIDELARLYQERFPGARLPDAEGVELWADKQLREVDLE
ncbi:MAG: right-handed parallel beta-helix repeat-containing protein [Elusimicrobia bacterium]|nr:right-handed parallel beta-helix repeat-containing protein [Elusimicrobiota bacterium]